MSDSLKSTGRWLTGIRTSDPMQARWYFRLRETENWLIVIVAFLVVNPVLQIFFHGFLGSTIAIVLVFCLFFFVLDKRTIGIACPHCGKHVETDTPWICGFCGRPNFNTDDFPVVGRCGNRKCRAKPKAYQCHHCGELIFFTNDRQKFNFARSVNVTLPQKAKPVQTDEHTTKVIQQRKDIELTRLQVDKAKLDVELKSYKDVLEPEKPKGAGEKLRSRVRTRAELDDEVRRLKAEADKEFANDEEALKKRHLEIDDEAAGLI